MQALLKKRQQWKNQEGNPIAPVFKEEIALGKPRVLLAVVSLFKGLRALARLIGQGRGLVRHHAPGVYEELNELEGRLPPRLF